MRLVALVALLASGCGATFIDDRPPRPDAAEADLLEPAADGGPAETVLARGSFEGRDGHFGRGTAELIAEGGGLVLRFAGDFQVSGVPGPFVYLSARDDLDTQPSEAEGDIELAPLSASAGAQRYAVPAAAASLCTAFVFCKPFGVEVARALLVSP